MKYITGIHALNLGCPLDTCGDWHRSALRWVDITYGDSEESLFGDYGIEYCDNIPDHPGIHPVANHIRALLDLIADGRFSVAQGMNKDFICNSDYDVEIFAKVCMMSNLQHWAAITEFMRREYRCKWLDYTQRVGL